VWHRLAGAAWLRFVHGKPGKQTSFPRRCAHRAFRFFFAPASALEGRDGKLDRELLAPDHHAGDRRGIETSRDFVVLVALVRLQPTELDDAIGIAIGGR